VSIILFPGIYSLDSGNDGRTIDLNDSCTRLAVKSIIFLSFSWFKIAICIIQIPAYVLLKIFCHEEQTLFFSFTRHMSYKLTYTNTLTTVVIIDMNEESEGSCTRSCNNDQKGSAVYMKMMPASFNNTR
jgi:hypothetical protein